jgi:2-keto-3-deoxy-L-rhamnonate aldolase RhmA
MGGLEEIVRVAGIDRLYIGPNDCALGCGHGRSTYRDSVAMEHPIQHIITACRAAGAIAGACCPRRRLCMICRAAKPRVSRVTMSRHGSTRSSPLARSFASTSVGLDHRRTP